MEETAAKVGIVLIATRKYTMFLNQLVISLERYFFCGESFDIYLFTDDTKVGVDLPIKRATVHVTPIESYGFPWATLYRYKIISTYADWLTAKNIFYMDVDMRLADNVGGEILSDGLTAVQHPGYYLGGWGSRKTHRYSVFYLPQSMWNNYYCGGVQGGARDAYIGASRLLSEMIDIDLDTARDMGYEQNNGILAEWHDESAWNWYLKKSVPPARVLNPSYCYPESWDIPFEKKILALDKNHKEIRG